MSTMQDALHTFMAEAHTLLQEMEDGLLLLEQGQADDEVINSVFRAAHTIKGSAGLFGFDAVVSFTHHVESLLDQVRSDELQLSSAQIGTLLESRDHIACLLEAEVAGDPVTAVIQAEDHRLVQVLTQLPSGVMDTRDTDTSMPTRSESSHWLLTIVFGCDVFKMGMEPFSFVQYLAQLGECQVKDCRFLPPCGDDEFDPESCYTELTLDYRGHASQVELEAVFEFVRDDCTLTLMQQDDVMATDEVALNRNKESDDDAPAAEKAAGSTSASKLVRVHADKLDALINLVGELVIGSAGVSLLAGRHDDAELSEAAADSARLVEDIRESAMRLRMVEIGETFNRFRRVVRDVAAELDKKIILNISGGDTELDKTIVEKIGDPLTHLIRNAIDHGIEMPAVREAAGKLATGTLNLAAHHESGSIVIDVTDDGAGLNTARIRHKALERGLIAADAELTENAIHGLIFEPGFSTAEKLSNISGRGVGMDVVKRNIEALRGSITIDSTEGQGTHFQIRLPLTLAIIDGFLVKVAESHYVLPLEMVQECVEVPTLDDTGRMPGFIDLRGKVLPLLPLRQHLALGAATSRRQNVVVVAQGNRRVGLVVDELCGELQTVLKPLGPLFTHLRGISGSSILGSGDVALMLDIPYLIDNLQA